MKRFSNAALVLALAVAGSGCWGGDEVSRLDADLGSYASAYDGHIRLSLAHPYDAKKDDYELLLSAPFDVLDMAVCEVKDGQACEPGSPRHFVAEPIYLTQQRRFFKATASALLEDGLVLSFLAYDAGGAVVDTRTVTIKRVGGATGP